MLGEKTMLIDMLKKVFNDIDNIETCTYDSSNVLLSEYYLNDKKLIVVFSSGRKYVYNNCERYKYLMFKRAKSQGNQIHKLFNTENGKETHTPELLEILNTEALDMLLEKFS